MAKEIERKFLVDVKKWNYQGLASDCLQGYFPQTGNSVTRVRISDNQAYLSIKGKNIGITRNEYEYKIPVSDAQQLLRYFCEKPFIEKRRYLVEEDKIIWEVDVFKGANQGLVVAEVELKSADQEITLPDWVTIEVSNDARYYNSNLIANPYQDWDKPQ